MSARNRMTALSRIEKYRGWRFLFVVLASAVIVEAAETPVQTQQGSTDDLLRMVLPLELFATVGIESNIYFDNVVLSLNSANHAFDVTCPKGQQQSERWTWTPTAADVGEIPFQLEVRDDRNRVVSTGKTVIKVIETN